jgi:hypothetical protein
MLHELQPAQPRQPAETHKQYVLMATDGCSKDKLLHLLQCCCPYLTSSYKHHLVGIVIALVYM